MNTQERNEFYRKALEIKRKYPYSYSVGNILADLTNLHGHNVLKSVFPEYATFCKSEQPQTEEPVKATTFEEALTMLCFMIAMTD